MVNNDCHRMLYLNSADYKPAVKHGQVQPIALPAKHKGKRDGGRLSAKRKKGDSSTKQGSATPVFDPAKHQPTPLVGMCGWPALPQAGCSSVPTP